MANKDAAFGFRPTRHLTGGEVRTNEYAMQLQLLFTALTIFSGQVVTGRWHSARN